MSTKPSRESGSTSVTKEEKKAKTESASTHVTLRFKGEDVDEVRVYKMRRNIEMGKAMKLYNETRGVESNTFFFMSENGRRIREFHTPDELELEDGDQILAMLHRRG